MPNKIQKRDSQASRKRLINAAIKIFSHHGPEAATIDDICGKAGLNKRLAYHYFGSKEGIYKEALRVVYEQFFNLEIELGSMLLPAEELLEVLVRRYYKFLEAHTDFVKMICYENLNEGRMAKQLNLTGQKVPVIIALQLALQKGQADKRFREGIDVTELLVSIFALCFFYFSNQYTMSQFLGKKTVAKSNIDARIRHVVELLLHGIAHDDARNQMATLLK